MFGGSNWNGWGEYIQAKTNKVQEQLQRSLASERARGTSSSSNSSSSSSSSGEAAWWNKYLERPSSLFSSLTFYIDGLQRLEGPELISTQYCGDSPSCAVPSGANPVGGPQGGPPVGPQGGPSGVLSSGILSSGGPPSGSTSRGPPGGYSSGGPPSGCSSGGPPSGYSSGGPPNTFISGAPVLGEAVIECVQLKRVLVAHGGQISLSMGKGVTHILVDNVALGNQKWRKLRCIDTTQHMSCCCCC